jgi:hypothetical protein
MLCQGRNGFWGVHYPDNIFTSGWWRSVSVLPPPEVFSVSFTRLLPVTSHGIKRTVDGLFWLEAADAFVNLLFLFNASLFEARFST